MYPSLDAQLKSFHYETIPLSLSLVKERTSALSASICACISRRHISTLSGPGSPADGDGDGDGETILRDLVENPELAFF